MFFLSFSFYLYLQRLIQHVLQLSSQEKKNSTEYPATFHEPPTTATTEKEKKRRRDSVRAKKKKKFQQKSRRKQLRECASLCSPTYPYAGVPVCVETSGTHHTPYLQKVLSLFPSSSSDVKAVVVGLVHFPFRRQRAHCSADIARGEAVALRCHRQLVH